MVPPLLWAANAIVGRMVHTLVPPMTFNLLRWVVAFALLVPMGGAILRPGSAMWTQWRYLALLGLFGIGCYNSLQYLALQTSQPINVTLVGSGMPVWTLLVGRVFFDAPVRRSQVLGALCSVAGVIVVLSRGSMTNLARLQLVPGDLFMVLATVAWACYSWMLTRRPDQDGGTSVETWASFLLAQVVFGLGWAGLFTTVEWSVSSPVVHWEWRLAAAVAFVGVFPAVVAYGAFAVGVRRVGPTLAAFFFNLTPLFAALLSMLILGEAPHLHHAVAFLLIVAGIVVASSHRSVTT